MGCGTLIGLALTGVGAGMGVSAANAEKKGMNNAISANIAEMQRYQRQGQGILSNQMAQSTPQAAMQTINKGQQGFTEAAKGAQATGMGFAAPVNTETQATTAVRGAQGAKAMGEYAGYQTLPQSWSQSAAVDYPLLAINNLQASQRNSLLPALIQQASQSQSGRAALGQLLGGIGNAVSGMSSGGGGGGGGAGLSTLFSGFTKPSGSQVADQYGGYGLWAPNANAAGGYN